MTGLAPLDNPATGVALFIAFATLTIFQLTRGWQSLVDPYFTLADKQLAALTGVVLLTPIGVLLHELGHAAAATAYGARDITIHYYVLWGAVSYRALLVPHERWIIAAAGPATGAIIGLVALALSLRVRPWQGEILRHFGMWTVLGNLVFYPLMSMAGFIGDFHVIYSPATPTLSLIAAVGHVALALVGVLLYRRGVHRFDTVDYAARVMNPSMEPTIPSGTTWYYRPVAGPIPRGSIVIYRVDDHGAIGRVVGLPGETVEVRDGRLFVNGTGVAEPYLQGPMTYTVPATLLEPQHYFVLGDNRNTAHDSHVLGPIPAAQILGTESPAGHAAPLQTATATS